MAISPQRLTLYLYSAHRHHAVIFAIAQHSFLVSHRAYAVVLRLSPSVCTAVGRITYIVLAQTLNHAQPILSVRNVL